jgi:hypothetical protein
LFAVGWQDAKLKTLISNRCTTYPGSDCVRLRHHVACLNGIDVTQTYKNTIPRFGKLSFWKAFSNTLVALMCMITCGMNH